MNNQEFLLLMLELDNRITELKILGMQSQANPLFMGFVYFVSNVIDAYKKQHKLDELFINLKEVLEEE